MLRTIFTKFVKTSNKDKYIDRFFHIFWGIIRKSILSFGDPLIKYKLWKFEMQIPFSHNLPVVLEGFKNFNTNLYRVSKYISEKYSDLKIIDIGANIGDSVALLRSNVNFPILCIEGQAEYFSLLKKNTANMQEIYYTNSFLGENDEEIKANYNYERGTGIISNNSQSSMKLRKLDSVLEDTPEFKKAKLLKIDTDGFDFKILKGASQYLKETHPVIFTEFDQNLMKQINENFWDMFDYFLKHDYFYIIFYDNYGDYLLSTELNDKDRIEDLTSYFDNRNTTKYCDICVLHKDDKDLFEKIRKNELKFFSENR